MTPERLEEFRKRLGAAFPPTLELLGFRDVARELLTEVERLHEEIGTPPPGSHPDEAKPRDETWHKERANWTAEVERLRFEVAQLQSIRDHVHTERDKAWEALREIRGRFRLGGIRGGWEQEMVDICTLALRDGGEDFGTIPSTT